jgi:hypothetical protein
VPIGRPTLSPEKVQALIERAKKNDVAAQVELADHYLNAINKDKADAFDWLEKAAKGGDAWAQTWIGLFHERGERTKQDYKAAMKWYQKAADQGYPPAQDRIGKMYRDGLGVEKDYLQASQWFEKAAVQIDLDATFDLVVVYAMGGPALPQNYEKAYFWSSMTSNNKFFPFSGFWSDLTSEKRPKLYKEISNHLTSEQKLGLRKKSRAWQPPEKTKWMSDYGYHAPDKMDFDQIRCIGHYCRDSADEEFRNETKEKN